MSARSSTIREGFGINPSFIAVILSTSGSHTCTLSVRRSTLILSCFTLTKFHANVKIIATQRIYVSLKKSGNPVAKPVIIVISSKIEIR